MQIQWELEYQNLSLYKLSIETDHLQSARDTFGSKLLFSVKTESYLNLDERDLISIGGEIAWQSDNINIPSSWVIPEQPLHAGRQLFIPMSNQIIRQIENARNAGSIVLQISLHALCFIPENHDLNVGEINRGLIDSQFNWLRGRTTIIRSRQHNLFPIHREKWAELLNGMNVPSYRLVEIPILDLNARQNKRWDNVLKRYDSIIHKQRIGNYEECIEECRLVVDEIIPVLAAHLQLDMSNQKKSDEMVGKFFEKALSRIPEEEDHIKSYSNLMFSITNFTSLYHHAGKRPTLFGNLREQAEHVVIMCSAAVTAGAKMLQWAPRQVDA